MKRRKKESVHHMQMTNGIRAIIQQLFQEYYIETPKDPDVRYGSTTLDATSTFEPKLLKTPKRDFGYRSEDHLHV